MSAQRRTGWIGLILLCCVIGNTHVYAETYALVIGINDYTSLGGEENADVLDRKWKNLNGAVNDAEAMAALLRSRYGVPKENIRLLTAPTDRQVDANDYPTRARILEEIEQHLLNNASEDNELIFYYSGHGSQVKNTNSDEQDQFDESIVPADAITGEPDIRDKELRILFNKMLDQGARLVVIADSCHSGSISRGLPVEVVGSKKLSPREQPFKDFGDPGEVPSQRGAIVLSAASPAQQALETATAEGIPRGGFTYALIKSLLTANEGETLEQSFQRTLVYMKGMGLSQRPLLEVRDDKRSESLISSGSKGVNGQPSGVAVWVISATNNNVELLGGLDLGLYPGTIITFEKGEGQKALLRITENNGITQSRAEILDESTTTVESGDLGFVTEWAYYEPAELRVWLGSSMPAMTVAQQQDVRDMLHGLGVEWAGDPAREEVDFILSQEGDGWNITGGNCEQIGTSLQDLTATLENCEFKNAFVQLPPPENLRTILGAEVTKVPAIKVVDSPDTAHYLLTCTLPKSSTEARLQCAWLLPNQHVGDVVTALPVSTDWVDIEVDDPGKGASALKDFTIKLARLKSWVSLSSPPTRRPFPYQVEFWPVDNDEPVDFQQGVELGERYRIMLVSRSEDLQRDLRFAPPRYVYVGGINSYGDGVPVYPRRGLSAIEACETLPCKTSSHPEYQAAYKLYDYGPVRNLDTDILYVITSADKLDPSVLSFSGVRTDRDIQSRGNSPSQLEMVLSGTSDVNTRSRGSTPLNWSIQQYLVPVLKSSPESP